MAYGSSGYGSASYGGAVPSGAKVVQLLGKYTVIAVASPITKSGKYTIAIKQTPIEITGRYAIGIAKTITVAGKYVVVTKTTNTISGQYVVRPTMKVSGEYTVITTPSPIQISGRYGIGIATTITKSGQYAIGRVNTIDIGGKYEVKSIRPPITVAGIYVVKPTIVDTPDYSKGVVISEYVTSEQVLWKAFSASSNATTASLDVSTIGSLGVYVQVDAATTIYIQVLTADGWKNYDSIVFAASGSEFYPIWFFSFTQIRFQTSNAATITLECWLRT